jgi:8-oxo-dGTP pyrophosphatase MutT (NUDIX family)
MGISPYLRGLRAKIGHEAVLVPSVAVMARDDQGRVLLVRSVETGHWQTVGGAIDPGESPGEAARREAREETGLEVELTGLVGVYGGPEYRVTYPNGDVVDYVAIVFRGRVIGGVAAACEDEVDALGWFTEAEVAGLEMSAHTRSILDDTFRGGGPVF